MPLDIVFMGTPAFAARVLIEVLAAGHRVRAVYTQPPRPAGRGMGEARSPVHRLAAERGLRIETPVRLGTPETVADFRALGAHVAVVVAYGLLLPAAILTVPRAGCLNLHASALPRWRGAAPIQRAIMAGDTETAVMVMRMDEGLDTGPIGLSRPVAIGSDETGGDLAARMAPLGAALIVEALSALEGGALTFEPQSSHGATYAAKIGKNETRIDFRGPALEVHNHIRGLSPIPGAWFDAGPPGRAARIKVLRSERAPGAGPPGSVISDDLTVACGEGAVRFVEVQRAGKRPVAAQEFLRGFPVKPGTRFQPA